MTTYFSDAQGTTVGDYANFQTVFGNSTTNYYHNSERDDRHGRTVRRIIEGDINFQRILSSKILSVNSKLKGTSTPMGLQVVKVKKMEQTATICGYRGKFTATSFEPVAEKDRESFNEIMKAVLEAAMRGRSALLKQVFAVVESNVMTLIAHDELANGLEFACRYEGKEGIVFYYLVYTISIAVKSLRDDETVQFLVTYCWDGWSFNLQTLSWQYDPASLCLDPPNREHLEQPLFYLPPPLCQENLPRLNTAEITAFIEKGFGDVLHMIASYGGRWITDLSYYPRHGLLTLGTVVDLNKHEILAHLPSIPSPEWFCLSHTADVKANFSSSGRVDLLFQKTGNVDVTLDFGWRIPENDQLQLRCAFLCQSPGFCGNSGFCDDPDEVRRIIFIDQLGFRLEGTFHNDPTSRSTPAYLFVRPLPTEFVNNARCVRYPLPKSLFYWSYDPHGRNTIAEEDWKRFGIPELSMEEWISTFWTDVEYETVRDHLHSRNFNLDGKQYARERGYPELIFGAQHSLRDMDNSLTFCLSADPHGTDRIEEYESSDSEELEYSDGEFETSPSHSRLGSPSTSSLVEAPAECTMGQEEDTPMLDITKLAAATHIPNKHLRRGAGRVIEPRYVYAEHQDLRHKDDETSCGQTFEESSVRLICPLPRRGAFTTEPGISFLDFAPSSLHVNHSNGNRELNFSPYIPPDLSSTDMLVSMDRGNRPATCRSSFHRRDTVGIRPQSATTDSFGLLAVSQQNSRVGHSTINSNGFFIPHPLLNPPDPSYGYTTAVHPPGTVTSNGYYPPSVAGSSIIPHRAATNLNHVPHTTNNIFPSAFINLTPFPNTPTIGCPTDHSNDFAMHDGDTLSVPYGGVGQAGTTYTDPSSLRIGDMQSAGIEPTYETMVDDTSSQWNMGGSPNAFNGDNTYASPSLTNSVDLSGTSQLSTANLHHVPFSTADSSHYLAPSAIDYLANPSMAQDTYNPDGNASFASDRGGGRAPEQYQSVAPQIYQGPPIYYPYTTWNGEENPVPPSAFTAAWNQYSGDERRG
ncbi:hypothetical protein PQX77_011695 [Marasmius sp. AFHP31]|nr:hypothetical protein PQX77_011695 [Marasmius sp. AFHP31]